MDKMGSIGRKCKTAPIKKSVRSPRSGEEKDVGVQRISIASIASEGDPFGIPNYCAESIASTKS